MKKKTIRRVFWLLILLPLGLFGFAWINMNYFTQIDTAEVDEYYEILKRHAPPHNLLMLSAGVAEKEDLNVALRRMIGVMGLSRYRIDMVYGDQETPPAFVTNTDNEFMTITVSTLVKQRREHLNLLVHELSHISVWSLEPNLLTKCGDTKGSDKSIFKGTNLEKVTDTSGFFRGGGILSMNGLTDEVFFVPGQEFSTAQKLFGYIKPEQFGYLLARYVADHGISASAIMPFLEPAGKKYFTMGYNYLKRSGKFPKHPDGESKGIHWCPKCGNEIIVDLSGNRPPDIKCSICPFYRKADPWWGPSLRYVQDHLKQCEPVAKRFQEQLIQFKHDLLQKEVGGMTLSARIKNISGLRLE